MKKTVGDSSSSKKTSRTSKRRAERSCVACRETFPQEELLRVVLDPSGTPCVDYLGKLPGRGAYICPNIDCIKRAAKQGGLKRSFKRPVSITSDALMQEAWSASQRQIRSLLSLAQRAGKVVPGHTRVEWSLRQEEGELLLLAQDASVSVQRKFRRRLGDTDIPVYETIPKVDLGSCIGCAETSVILITDEGFAQKIKQELERAKRLIGTMDE